MKRIFSVLAFLLLLSCQWTSKEEYAIDRTTMKAILKDIHLVDGALATSSLPDSLDTIKPENYYYNIFRKYNVDRVLFDSALVQYTNNEELMLGIYTEMIEELSTQELFLKEKRNKQKQEKDEENLKKHFFKYAYHKDFEKETDIEAKYLTSKNVKQGSKAYISRGNKENLPLNIKVDTPIKKCEFHLKAWVRLDELIATYPAVKIEIRKGDEVLNEVEYSLKKFNLKIGKWFLLDINSTLNIKEHTKGVNLYCSFVNPDKALFSIDDYHLDIQQKQ